jgi:hypothetical protein
VTNLSPFDELKLPERISRPDDDVRRKATLTVAHRYATDVEDCRELLAMLGLDPADGRKSPQGDV